MTTSPGRSMHVRRWWVPVFAAWFVLAVVGQAQQQAPLVSVPTRISEGRTQMGFARWSEAVRIFDDALRMINDSPLPTEDKRVWLADVYLNRGIAYAAQKDLEGSKRDFRELLALRPTQTLPDVTPAPAAQVQALFDEVQRTVVGTLKLRISPEDAEVRLDDVRMTDPGAEVRLAAGRYTVVATRKSYTPGRYEIFVPAGELTEREVALVRASSTVQIVTVPADVEVLFGTAVKGKTPPGPPPAEYGPALGQAGIRPADASARLEIADVPAGIYELVMRKPCFVDKVQSFDATQLRDYAFGNQPFVLERAVGTIRVAGDPGEVFLDGTSRGSERALTDACEGTRSVEVRSPVGRFVTTLDVKTKSDQTVNARVRPALALMAQTGQQFQGDQSAQLLLQRFGNDASLTVFQPSAAELDRAMKESQVKNGWLSQQAANFTATAMHDVSQRASRTLAVQGLAEVDVPSLGNVRDVVLTFVAAGSSKSDSLRIDLSDARAVQDVMRRLEVVPAIVHQSAGLEVSDVYDRNGDLAVVVSSVEPQGAAAQAGVVPGDVVTTAGGTAIKGASAFLKILAAAKDGDSLAVELRDRSDNVTDPKRVTVKVTGRPAVIAQDDQTLLPNRLIMDYRRRLASSTGREAMMLRLNLGVALMKVESWEDAVTELKQVTLGSSPGVSDGTVQYLLARCYGKLGMLTQEAAALDLAGKSDGAQLVVNGPLITELVKRERAGARSGGR